MRTRSAVGSEASGSTGARTGLARQSLGRYGEAVAARHLVERGMVVLDRNWRCDLGEIDLVLRDGPVLVICEVKTRSGLGCGSPHEAVDEVKLARLQLLGLRWMEERGIRPDQVRVDVVGVLQAGRGAAAVEHVAGVG